MITATGPAPETDALAEFLAAPRSAQATFVENLGIPSLRNLCSLYVDSIGNRALKPMEYDLFERMLERLDPQSHMDSAQESDLRESLTLPALARLRADTYDNKLRPLLHLSADQQDSRLASLDPEKLANLLKLLDRYAREYGRSHRVRDLESRIREML